MCHIRTKKETELSTSSFMEMLWGKLLFPHCSTSIEFPPCGYSILWVIPEFQVIHFQAFKKNYWCHTGLAEELNFENTAIQNKAQQKIDFKELLKRRRSEKSFTRRWNWTSGEFCRNIKEGKKKAIQKKKKNEAGNW